MNPFEIPTFELWKIDDWMEFIVDNFDANLLRDIRSRISNLFLKFLKEFRLTDDEAQHLDIVISIVEEDPIEREIKKIRAKALNDNL